LQGLLPWEGVSAPAAEQAEALIEAIVQVDERDR
jgi:hypothetical protein